MNRFQSIRAGVRILKHAAALALVTTVAACTAGGPPTTQAQQTTPGPAAASYTGPAASNADVQAFKVNLWENIRVTDKCGRCHNADAGGQSPMFARSDDVNQAYTAANPLVNVTQPELSELVVKVSGGHNCWVADPKACGDTMLTWIKAWVGASATATTGVTLTPPPSGTVGGGKQFPPTAETQGTVTTPPFMGSSFQQTVYPLLAGTPANPGFCVGCHRADSASPQTPYFASSNVDEAYAAAQAKMNLNAPDQSRFVVRLRDEHHNCWTTQGPPVIQADCAGSSAAMLAAITAFANGINTTPVDNTLVLSKALKLKDGTIASGGNRSEANLVAKYEFKTGQGVTAYDTSGVSPAADLLFTGDVSWVGGWGININTGGKAQASTAASAKITSMITSTGEFSIEAWIAPANVAQTDAWIVSYSGSDKTRNATLGQHAMQYQGATRSSKTDPNGSTKPLLTSVANFPVQAALQHVVLTYDPVNGQKLYLNGVPDTVDKDPNAGGSLASWDNTFALVLGSETTGKEQWLGVVKFVAIHNRALNAAQIAQNYTAGVGEKYFMLFDVAALSGVPQSYIEVTGSVLDSYAYQFSTPTFVSLDPTAVPANLPIKGIRFGVNGIELPNGQSYATVNTTVGAPAYTATAGQVLSNVGAVVAADKGPDTDMFFLTFEQIGTHSHAHTEPGSTTPVQTFPAVDTSSRKGVKNFAQINAALSQITGVPVSNTTVNSLYNTLQQSLPPSNSLTAFLASHQTAIGQLADAYCNVAVNTPSTPPMFPGLDLTQPAATYFGTTTPDAAHRALVINPLINRAIGSGVGTLTTVPVVTTALNDLISNRAAVNGTVAGRTASITQAACTAVLGSAVVSLQ